jgi:hypothetical protein
MNAPTWDRVKQIFQDALERPPHERAAYVRDTIDPLGDDNAQYDVAEDGRRFLINRPTGEQSASEITVIANALPLR